MTNQIDVTIKEAFWTAVERCLVFFHSVSAESAHNDVADLRRRFVEELEDDPIIYHDDPFYLAADMVNSPVVLDNDTFPPYEKILNSVGLKHTRG